MTRVLSHITPHTVQSFMLSLVNSMIIMEIADHTSLNSTFHPDTGMVDVRSEELLVEMINFRTTSSDRLVFVLN